MAQVLNDSLAVSATDDLSSEKVGVLSKGARFEEVNRTIGK